MGKFSLSKAVACKPQPEKRPADEEMSPYSQVRSGKMLKVSQVGIEEDGPKPGQKNPRKLSANAPIEISIRKYMDCAGDLWESFQSDEDKALYQCQIKQDSARSLDYQFRERFQDYCRATAGVPDTLQELQDKCGIRLVLRRSPNIGIRF